MTEQELVIEEAAFDVLVSFVQFGDEPTEGDLAWARANTDQKTPNYYLALRYAKAALNARRG